jgi:N-acetylglucosamine-6-phosphate deacetylase
MQSWVGTALLVPKSASDPERTSIILEAMASSAKHYITPAYYDVVLTRKYSRDDESSAIIDLLRNNRQFDLVYTYNFGNIRSMNKVLIADSNTIASSLASLKDATKSAYEEAYKAVRDSME